MEWFKTNIKWLLALIGTAMLILLGVFLRTKGFQKKSLELQDAKENLDRKRKEQKVESLKKSQQKIEEVEKQIVKIDEKKKVLAEKREKLSTAKEVADAWNSDD